LGWTVDEVGGILDLSMSLHVPKSALEIESSVYQVAKRSWALVYGDYSLGCQHGRESVGRLIEGETVDIVTPGHYRAFEDIEDIPSSWKPLRLFSAYGNDVGQVASLLSAAEGSRGMVRREACLRCCVTTAQKMNLDFLIDRIARTARVRYTRLSQCYLSILLGYCNLLYLGINLSLPCSIFQGDGCESPRDPTIFT